MPTGEDGKFYRTHGQAARLGKKPAAAAGDGSHQEGQQMTDGKENAVGKGGNVLRIKHSGRDEEGNAKPPFHVMHEDGSKHGPMNSHEELHAHLQQHMGGSEMEHEADQPNEGIDGMESEGADEAIKSLLG
jgi:hypothetical protein